MSSMKELDGFKDKAAALQHIVSHFNLNKKGGDAESSNKSPLDISELFKVFNSLSYSPDVQSLRGLCMESIHKNQLALYIYQQILVRHPFHGPTLRRKSQLLKKMGKKDQVKQAFQLAALLEPDNLHLQILRDEQASQSSQQQDNIQDSENQGEDEQKNSSWTIRIKSIDRPIKHIGSYKSVLFSQELIQLPKIQKQSNSLSIIKPKKSILKARSYQQDYSDDKVEEETQIPCKFEVKKIKSIDGKMSIHQKQNDPKKQILFSFCSQRAKLNKPSCSNLQRKSSLMISKISSSSSLNNK